MKIVVFGLSVSSSWGNGHATLLRGLFRALSARGHEIEFFELDTPYYAAHRDAPSLPYVKNYIYSSWHEWRPAMKRSVAEADIAIVTSYCAHGAEASQLIFDCPRVRSVFYDMDTPVTFRELDNGNLPTYLPKDGLGRFDVVLSYTGGTALERLRSQLGARNAAPLYGWVDPATYHPVEKRACYAADLSYLGTYAADRQEALEKLLISPAREATGRQFIIAGAMHSNREMWPNNIRYFDHIAPPDHAAFYSSSPLTLSVTRGAMARMGYCPSGRLFEAAACGTAVVTDYWEGIEEFFVPGQEILIAQSQRDITDALQDSTALSEIGARARERVLECHTADVRAVRLIELIEDPPQMPEVQNATVCQGER